MVENPWYRHTIRTRIYFKILCDFFPLLWPLLLQFYFIVVHLLFVQINCIHTKLQFRFHSQTKLKLKFIQLFLLLLLLHLHYTYTFLIWRFYISLQSLKNCEKSYIFFCSLLLLSQSLQAVQAVVKYIWNKVSMLRTITWLYSVNTVCSSRSSSSSSSLVLLLFFLELSLIRCSWPQLNLCVLLQNNFNFKFFPSFFKIELANSCFEQK